jgi:hypothetical protein
MRMTKVIFSLAMLAAPLLAQEPAPAPQPTASAQPSDADQYSWEKRHQSALKFLEATDARKRLEGSLDKLLTDGRSALLQRNQGLDPRFADEWLKRMRTRVSVDDLFNATVQVYETHFTSDELDELTRDQLALKRGQIYTLPTPLAEKLKTNTPIIQRAINMKTSIIGANLGRRVGQEIEKEHPEWGKDTGPATPPTRQK